MSRLSLEAVVHAHVGAFRQKLCHPQIQRCQLPRFVSSPGTRSPNHGKTGFHIPKAVVLLRHRENRPVLGWAMARGPWRVVAPRWNARPRVDRLGLRRLQPIQFGRKGSACQQGHLGRAEGGGSGRDGMCGRAVGFHDYTATGGSSAMVEEVELCGASFETPPGQPTPPEPVETRKLQTNRHVLLHHFIFFALRCSERSEDLENP